eukprot:SAG11_NODE_13661_length_644_cov_2.842202_1_plen_71_part_01
MKMVRVDPRAKWRILGIFKIWEGVSAPEPSLFHLLTIISNLVANMGQTTLFNVASQSIDRLWGTARLQAYN